VLEVLARCGVARTGNWTTEGRVLGTPNVLFVDTSRHRAPSLADALLRETPSEDPRPTFVDQGSIFRPRTAHGNTIPPDAARPSVLSDLERPAPPPGPVVVAATAKDVEARPEAQVVVLGDAIAYLRRPKPFVAAIVELRRSMGYARLLYAPGLATPGNLAILVYGGVDLVDSTRVLFESTLGRFHSADGTWDATHVDPGACSCPACAVGGAGKDLEGHNTRALFEESRYVAMAIRAGRLRELAERRAVNEPWSTAVLREFDLRHFEWQEFHAPVAGGTMLAYTAQSLHRPEVLRFRRRLVERYAKPPSASVLLLLPCSARKPYADSKTHRRFREALWAAGNPHAVHEVIVTSPFGLVPRELERVYPAAHYDVPVTGDWSRDEVAVLQGDLRSFLAANRYDAVVAHVTTEAPFVREIVPDALFTAGEKTTEETSLAAMTEALASALRDVPRVPAHARMAEDLRNLAVFQFGPEGAALVAGATFRGRYPDVRIVKDGTQVGSVTELGKVSLTLEGGRILSSANAHWVEIEDFYPEGSVFAVGVTGADERVRVGDEVVVRHRGDVRAVGVAAMNPREMVDLRRGEAVKVRHKAKKA
jgi:archaeosine synthase